jgi:hypothetical protein
MPIPAFNQLGLLPEGIHECDMLEAQRRIGSFQASDRRPQLWANFLDFVRLAKTDRFIEKLLIDGSFVTVKPDPSDIDVKKLFWRKTGGRTRFGFGQHRRRRVKVGDASNEPPRPPAPSVTLPNHA